MTFNRSAVCSSQNGLSEYSTNAMVGGPVTLGVRDVLPVQLNFNVLMESDQHVWGFADKPQLEVTIVYDDGYGREVTNYTETFPIKVRIPNYVLVVAML